MTGSPPSKIDLDCCCDFLVVCTLSWFVFKSKIFHWSKKLCTIQAIIAPLNEGYEERAQHWGCRIWILASNEYNALKVIRSNLILYNFCPWNELDSPPWVARNLQSPNVNEAITSKPSIKNLAKISPLLTLQLWILSTGARFKVISCRYKGTFIT